MSVNHDLQKISSHSSDARLLAAVQQGDQEAMATLYSRYSRLVYSVALRVLREASAAEDVLQEIFLQMWRTPTTFLSSRGSLGGWLAVVSRNRAIDVLRRRRPSELLDSLTLPSDQNLAAELEQRVTLGRVQQIMLDLPGEQRRVLEMAFFQGLTHSEIAAQTGDPLGTVKTRMRMALKSLGKSLREPHRIPSEPLTPPKLFN